MALTTENINTAAEKFVRVSEGHALSEPLQAVTNGGGGEGEHGGQVLSRSQFR